MDTPRFESVYVHFPFCETKCHYCDFFSLPESHLDERERTGIYEAILAERNLYSGTLAPTLNTLFLGGGTPSLVPPDTLRALIGAFGTTPDTEVTMEANPSSVSLDRARAWRAAGVTRVSMGMQALDDERLRWLGRVHTKRKAFDALEAMHEAGIPHLSVDYIVGVPRQSCADIEREVREVLGRFPGIRHMSAYLLTLKPSNPRSRDLPGEDEQLAHLRTVSAVLRSHGFEQYEISNFARSGARARHNENYWLGGGYLGLGPSAHSFWPTPGKRTKNCASLGKYREQVSQRVAPLEWEESLTTEQQRLEYLMLRLRRSEGLDLREYRRLFGRDLYAEHGHRIESWIRDGLCRLGDRLALTADGFFLSDQIVGGVS